jgi:hypothetical protein
MAQKPNNGKPLSASSQSTPHQLSILINRVKQDSNMDDAQRADMNDQKQQMFSSLINKSPFSRPSSTTVTASGSFNQQQWHSSPSQQPPQFTPPPPNYSAATRARFTPVLQQQAASQPSAQTLLAPLRPNTSTPPPTYLPRPSSTPNITRPPMNVTISRPSPYSSQSQDPSAR